MKRFLCFLISGVVVGSMFSAGVFVADTFTSPGAVSAVSEKTLNGVSDWAENEVRAAIEKGLVPEILQKDYTKNITREEFCGLCAAVLKAWGSDFEYKNSDIIFLDTSNRYVLECAEIGIVNGVGDDKFAPNNPIKRQEAARMLYNTLSVGTSVMDNLHNSSKTPECCIPHSFNDGGIIRNWARDEIAHMYRYGVMLGVSEDNYDPDGYYTREQAICTFLRLFNCYGNMEANPIPEADYYPYGQTAKDYISDGIMYAIDYDKENYRANYIDSEGNRYTEKEKGYIYPFDKELGIFFTSMGVGLGLSVVIDKDGKETNIPADYQILKNSGAAIKFESNILQSTLYSVPDMKEVFSGNGVLYKIGDNLYEFVEADSSSAIIDSKGNVIIDKSKGYTHRELFTTMYNGFFVLANKNGGCDILNSKCEVIKHCDIDPSWNLWDSVGTNAHFYNSDNDKHIFYRCYSGVAAEYDYVTLTENNEAIVRGPHFHNYILNADGSVKFDAGKFGYKNVEKVRDFDFYQVLKDNGESGLCDIVDKNGKVIKTNINRGLGAAAIPSMPVAIDKSGVFAYVKNKVVKFFDFYGNDLGEFDLSGVYGSDTEVDIKFINGMLFVTNFYPGDEREDVSGIYITPQGKRFI